jgi:hypothetical protein
MAPTSVTKRKSCGSNARCRVATPYVYYLDALPVSTCQTRTVGYRKGAYYIMYMSDSQITEKGEMGVGFF